MKLAFQQVPELNFVTYLEDLRRKLETVAPHWSIESKKDPEKYNCTYYHLARTNFLEKRKDQPETHTIYGWIFGYENEDEKGNRTFFLINHSPIISKAQKAA